MRCRRRSSSFANCNKPVRNRAKELVELLNDTDKIRAERKKARQNRNKYQGVGSESLYSSGGMGSRYGGFGSGSGGGLSISASGGSFGMGGGSGYFDEDERPNRFESSKYDDFDDSPPQTNTASSSRSSPAKAAEPKREANLFDFDDDAPASQSKRQEQNDEWGDFASGGQPSSSAFGMETVQIAL